MINIMKQSRRSSKKSPKSIKRTNANRFKFTRADYKRAERWRAQHPYIKYTGRVRLTLVDPKRPISASEFSMWLRQPYRDYTKTHPRYKSIIAAVFEGAGDMVSNVKIDKSNLVTFELRSRSRDRSSLLWDLKNMKTASSSARQRLEWYDSPEDERIENEIATVGASFASLERK